MHPTTFRASNYEYKVELGTVSSPDALGWQLRVFVREWDEVERVVRMWRQTHDEPVTAVKTRYIDREVR